MNISKTKLVMKFLFGGGVGGVVDYLLDILNSALGQLSEETKGNIIHALKIAENVLAWLMRVSVLVPKKRQSAYVVTIDAVQNVVISLHDLELTREEIVIIRDKFNTVVLEWKAD